MDKDDVDKEFEGLLIYNDFEVTETDETERVSGTAMSLTELSSISQDLQSMLWYIQEIITRTLEEDTVSVDEEAIVILRRMQEESMEVIEGLVLSDDDNDEQSG